MSQQNGSPGRKSGLLKHQIKLVKRRAPDGNDRYEILPIEDSLSFEKGFFLFIRAVKFLTEKNNGVVLVGLAGPSGAGKTVFSQKVTNVKPGIVSISMDNYNDASRVIDGNYDDPRLTDYDTLLENIKGLREGRAVDVPIYDFKSSSRVGYRRVEVPESRIIIIEGIYALSEKLRPLLDLRVSITGGVHFDLVKRVLRDINRSGQEPQDIIHQISETVYPMYKVFIEPDLQTAHIKIVNKFNPFSGFQDATYILKSPVVVTEDQIRGVLSPQVTEATEETYDIYLLPPGEDQETCQSYLRMRNRDGRYSLMFEEWVTDDPYIISPRITFEVSVRLLGGLMALGYEMASILKRVSRVFTDEQQNCCVKVDKLEQLQRTYIQVQGKDRQGVRRIAQELGMEDNYMPRSYIEQIQLERLTEEVQTVPAELKERLGSGLEELVASPRFASSWADSSLPSPRNSQEKSVFRSQSWQPQSRKHRPKTEPGPKIEEQEGGLDLQLSSIRKRDAADSPRSPLPFSDTAISTRYSEQLQAITERLDELLSRILEVEMRLPEKPPSGRGSLRSTSTNGLPPHGNFGVTGNASTGVQPLQLANSWGSVGASPLNVPTNVHNGGHGSAYTSTGSSPTDGASLAEEIRLLVRGQRHLATQLDVLSNIVRDSSRDSIAGSSSNRSGHGERGWWEGLFGSMRTGNAGLATVAVLSVAGVALVGGLAAAGRKQS